MLLTTCCVVIRCLPFIAADVFFWCAENGAPCEPFRIATAAARAGSVEILDFILAEHGPTFAPTAGDHPFPLPSPSRIKDHMLLAASCLPKVKGRESQLEVFEWLRTNDLLPTSFPNCPPCYGSHWLNDITAAGATELLDWVAAKGYQFDEGFVRQVIIEARSSFLDLPPGSRRRAQGDANALGLSVIRWAVAHKVPFPKPESAAVRLACTHNRKEILIYFRETLKLPWGSNPLRYCPPYGEAYKWAIANGAPERKDSRTGDDDDDDDYGAGVGYAGDDDDDDDPNGQEVCSRHMWTRRANWLGAGHTSFSTHTRAHTRCTMLRMTRTPDLQLQQLTSQDEKTTAPDFRRTLSLSCKEHAFPGEGIPLSARLPSRSLNFAFSRRDSIRAVCLHACLHSPTTRISMRMTKWTRETMTTTNPMGTRTTMPPTTASASVRSAWRCKACTGDHGGGQVRPSQRHVSRMARRRVYHTREMIRDERPRLQKTRSDERTYLLSYMYWHSAAVFGAAPAA